MANCFNHADKEGIYVCCKCWLSFCSSCFDQENKVCKNCIQKLDIKHDNLRIRKSVLLFVSVCSVLVVVILALFFISSKQSTSYTTASNKTGQPSKTQQTASAKADHFIVEGAQNTDSMKSKSEEYYQSLPLITGLPPGDTLGLNKIKIRIFDTKEEYAQKTGKPSWSEGYADYEGKEIFVTQSDGLEKSIIPHEISHLFFDSYMGYESSEFNWLDEGVATLVQVKYDNEQAASFAEPMEDIRNNRHIPLTQLTTYVLTQQTPNNQVNKYYAESLSITHYLLNKDFEKWKTLLAHLKSKKKFNQALKDAYDLDLPSLEQEWLTFIKSYKQTWEAK